MTQFAHYIIAFLLYQITWHLFLKRLPRMQDYIKSLESRMGGFLDSFFDKFF